MKFSHIAVCGAGQMGSGIAQVAAQTGLHVFLYDSQSAALEKAKVGIEKSLTKLREKAQISEDPKQILARISFVSHLDELKKAKIDLLIEAIVENFDIKKKLFTELDLLLDAKVIFASNTSSISITKLAAVTSRPEKFCGMHFMNPVPLMKLVEMIKGLQTDEKVFHAVCELAQSMGKTTVVSRDLPGFIVNRILMPMINEAIFALQDGMGSVEDIDQGMKLGTNQPMGPLTLADFIGLDTCLAIMNVLFEGLGDSKYRPAPLLKQYVDAGWLGKKSRRGFYKYE